jgi:uncharacterized membrane protein
MTFVIRFGWSVLLACWLVVPHPALAEQPVVHAVLFWSDTCPHCHDVIENVLPPIQTQYGAQFQLKMLQVQEPANAALYETMARSFNLAPERQGVPALLVGDQVLVGSEEIPAQLPGQIERFLAAGGVDFPALPGLDRAPAVDMCGAVRCADNVPQTIQSASGDPVANALAGAVLLGLGATVVYALGTILRVGRQAAPAPAPGHQVRGPRRHAPVMAGWAHGLIPVFALLGLGAASYLAYTKLAHTSVVCGPVGDCDAVQTSIYSELFGIPVAMLGALTYLAMLVCWVGSCLASARLAMSARLGLFGLSLMGAMFSFYLTFLEPFVIGAVCAWCLTSAICLALILLLASRRIHHDFRPALRQRSA